MYDKSTNHFSIHIDNHDEFININIESSLSIYILSIKSSLTIGDFIYINQIMVNNQLI